jgi:hypothetical protein
MDFTRDLASSLRRAMPDEKKKGGALRPSSLQLFLEDDIPADKGPWSLQGHEPFAGILAQMDDAFRKPLRDTEIALLKAEQIGATTTLGFGPALHLAADLGVNVGYFLPSDVMARKFGRTRIKRIIQRSEYLAARMKDGESVNQVTVKEFDGSFFYLFGLESMIGAISTPLDVLLYDEVDLLPAENMEWSRGRVAHSDLRVSVYFSAGYSPGAGIDLRYQEGTQHKWRVNCLNRRCKERDICLEEVFPDCLAVIGGSWVRVCPSCNTPLDIVRDGRWVATYPGRARERRRISYRLSALAMSAMDPNAIMKRWGECRTKSQKAKFNCSVLAIPDAGAMQPFSDVELNKMQSGEVKRLRQDRGALPRFAGLDTGDLCHFICYERIPNGAPRLVWAEEIDSDVALERVSTLITKLGVTQMVPDKKPQTILARALAYKFPRIVALQDFAKNAPLQVVEEEHERKKYRCVKVDRNESIDEMASEFTGTDSFLRIPDLDSDPVMAVVATHLKNLRKERTIDAIGRAVDKYLKGVPNHFGMALNSARIAEQLAPANMPFSFTPVSDRAATAAVDRWKSGVLGG